MSGWDVLACSDQAMPMRTDGVKDMFYLEEFDYDGWTDYCSDTYGNKPDYDYTLNHFGGVTDKEYLAASKIIFTNGGLDPWSGASPNTHLSDTLQACLIRKYWVMQPTAHTTWISARPTPPTPKTSSSAANSSSQRSESGSLLSSTTSFVWSERSDQISSDPANLSLRLACSLHLRLCLCLLLFLLLLVLLPGNSFQIVRSWLLPVSEIPS